MILAQLEVFIFLGNLLFADLNFDRSPAEITRIIFVRFMIFIAACLVFSMLIFLALQYATLWLRGEDTSKVLSDFIHAGFNSWFKSTIKGLTLGAVIFIVLLWQTSLRREQKFREENLIFQNETLKSQVNPHFLFNSLNTVSSLIQTHPDKAEQFINNLSSVYRYILENGQKDKVAIQSELDLVNRYFDLHRVRDEEKIMLSIDYSDADSYQILPVSLQILLENAIKHNIATRENPLEISICFEGQYIVVKNNLQRKATQLKSTGIGLKNLAERVRFISGKDLIIEETDKSFTVKIPLLK
jgi:LytS/YehU family sensor histidine kinase